jgi:hypothetical protein
MTSAWVRAQDRKRSLVAAASTACLYAIIFLAACLLGLIAPVSLASVPSTVIVDLGNGEGPAGQVPLGLAGAPDRPEDSPPGAAPLPAAGSGGKAVESAALPEAAPLKASPNSSSVKSVKAPPAKASANTIPEKSAKAVQEEAAAAAAAQERAAAEDAAVRAAVATAQASAAPAKTKTFGASAGSGTGSGGAPVTGNGTGSEPGVAGGTGSYTFRGAEMGNALTYTFGGSSGQVGRNIYVPIYLYMPLPLRLSDSIYRNIAAKQTFRSYYEQSGSDWQLKEQPQVSQRGDIWTMLESAGYDASTADYRTSRKLSPVVLEFAVGPVSKSRVDLVDVRLVSSSGSGEIDEAVMYGFRQASFFNKTGYAVGGKFVYGF